MVLLYLRSTAVQKLSAEGSCMTDSESQKELRLCRARAGQTKGERRLCQGGEQELSPQASHQTAVLQWVADARSLVIGHECEEDIPV